MKRVWLGLFIAFMGLQVYVLFFKKEILESKDETPKTDAATAAAVQADQIQQMMQGGHLVESQQGKRDWELFSKKSVSYQGRNDWDLEVVEIRFYNSELQDLKVTGLRGNIEMDSKNMRIEGDVKIETANGSTFLAPFIQYHAQTRVISCDQLIQVLGPVQNKKRTMKMKATGIRIPINEQQIYLENKVSGEQILEDQQIVKFSSDRATLSSTQQKAEFSGNVRIEHAKRFIKSQEAHFNYDEVSKTFESLELKKNVELLQDDRRALSDELKIDFASQRLTFSGQPRLYQGEDELVGDRIIFLDGGKRVKVENVKAKGSPIE